MQSQKHQNYCGCTCHYQIYNTKSQSGVFFFKVKISDYGDHFKSKAAPVIEGICVDSFYEPFANLIQISAANSLDNGEIIQLIFFCR